MYRDFRDPVFVSYFRAPLIHAGGRNARRTTPSANRGSARRRDTTMRFAITEDNALSSAATLASLFPPSSGAKFGPAVLIPCLH